MIVYGSSPQIDSQPHIFSEARDSEHPFAYFVRDDIILDLTCDSNIAFYEYEGEVCISDWMKANSGRKYSSDIANILGARNTLVAKFSDSIVGFNTKYCIRKPDINEVVSVKILVLSPDELRSKYRNQELPERLRYATNLWSDVDNAARYKFLCFICADVNGYLVGLSKVMEAMESTVAEPWIASSLPASNIGRSLPVFFGH
jgi:hypothetical protein